MRTAALGGRTFLTPYSAIREEALHDPLALGNAPSRRTSVWFDVVGSGRSLARLGGGPIPNSIGRRLRGRNCLSQARCRCGGIARAGGRRAGAAEEAALSAGLRGK